MRVNHEGGPMATPMDPTSQAFMIAESRNTPMHVGGLQLFRPPDGRRPDWARDLYESRARRRQASPRSTSSGPTARSTTAGSWFWTEDDRVRPRVPRPAQRPPRAGSDPRAARALRPAARHPAGAGAAAVGDALHRGARATAGSRSTRKLHHALVDGVSAMRLLQARSAPTPTCATTPPPWARRSPPRPGRAGPGGHAEQRLPRAAARRVPLRAGDQRRGRRASRRADQDPQPRAAQRDRADRRSTRPGRSSTRTSPAPAGSPPRTGRSSGSARSARPPAPRSTTSCSRCAAARCGTTCSSSTRCRTQSLIAMVPVSLKLRTGRRASVEGGNAVGDVMVKLGTDLADPADRLEAIHRSVKSGKEALGTHVADCRSWR